MFYILLYTMYIYEVSRNDNYGYDQYDGFVCCAKTRSDALKTHPSGDDLQWEKYGWTWVSIKNIQKLSCRNIGKPTRGISPGVILASFNAW